MTEQATERQSVGDNPRTAETTEQATRTTLHDSDCDKSDLNVEARRQATAREDRRFSSVSELRAFYGE
ncbi:hypothetical protein [Bifidobacterium sp. SO1]|uniref:hypothetical protein n=1 Tax=Bifidobacterium sp. SO1 TaxID=2809029 RepID=UPI001BDC2F8A|nr:hypothetical protein [Bifidobacterium sp. SO1]MBT1162229.1 hypothetical protein [Bifidobacterium sp. SO1]